MGEDGSDTERPLVKQRTTGEDRVRMAARQLSEPRTANWVASEADWSYEPTKRVLERLVDDGLVRRDDEGTHTTYVPDYRQQAMREAMVLRESEDSVEALTDRLSEMNAKIRDWEDEFGVDSPNELRATIADADLTPQAESRRREVARTWAHLERRIDITGFAIREWEFLTPGSAPAEAGN